MVKEAKIKVSLDTKKAKQDLRDLGKQGEAAAGRVAGGVRGEKGGSSIAKGFGIGAGFAIGKRLAGSAGFFSSITDVMGEVVSGIGADFDKWSTAPIQRAKKGARDQTSQDMALLTYYSGDTTAAKAYYNQVLEMKHLPQQVGATEIQKALAGGRAESPEGMGPLDKLLNTVVDSIVSGFTSIRELLGG